MINSNVELAFWKRGEDVSINYQLNRHGLLQVSIFLQGSRYGAAEETLTYDNYFTFTVESMTSEKMDDWCSDLPAPYLAPCEWWMRYDSLDKDTLSKLDSKFSLDSNPYTDFYDNVIFRYKDKVFLFWRLRSDTDFWKDFPSLNNDNAPNCWKFNCDELRIRSELMDLHDLVLKDVMCIRNKSRLIS